MKKKILALSAIVALTAGTSFGQQDKLLTHFMFDKMTLNPASTGMGMNSGICGTMIYRNQWDKVNGAPNSAVFNVESNLSRFGSPVNLGLSVYHDAIGFARQNNAILNASVPVYTGNAGTLALGVGVGIINFGMDPVWIPPTNVFDSKLPTPTSGTGLDINAGIYWRGQQDYYAGISTAHLSQTQIKSINYSTARHYNIMGGKRFVGLFGTSPVSKDLDVQVMMRTDMVKFSADISARYMHGNLFYGGLTYRTSDAISLMAGFVPMTNFTVGYSYDLTINQLSNISRGTHELMVKYCYFFPPPPVHKSKHPRWL